MRLFELGYMEDFLMRSDVVLGIIKIKIRLFLRLLLLLLILSLFLLLFLFLMLFYCSMNVRLKFSMLQKAWASVGIRFDIFSGVIHNFVVVVHQVVHETQVEIERTTYAYHLGRLILGVEG